MRPGSVHTASDYQIAIMQAGDLVADFFSLAGCKRIGSLLATKLVAADMPGAISTAGNEASVGTQLGAALSPRPVRTAATGPDPRSSPAAQ